MAEKRFLIPVRRRWTLLVLPILALLYFIALLTLVALGYEIQGVDTELLVLAGAALFGLVVLIELPFLIRRKVKQPPTVVDEPVEPDAAAAYPGETATDADVFAPPAAQPLARGVVDRDDELRTTSETLKGLAVLEYSRPAKSANPGAVYAKTLVTVTKEHVLRLETLAAESHEL